MFDKREVYSRVIAPLLDRVFTVCKEHNIPFSYSCTVEETPTGTVVSKGGIGAMDPSKTDPYTRINLALMEFSTEEAEMVFLCLMVILAGSEEERDRKTEMNNHKYNQRNVKLN